MPVLPVASTSTSSPTRTSPSANSMAIPAASSSMFKTVNGPSGNVRCWVATRSLKVNGFSKSLRCPSGLRTHTGYEPGTEAVDGLTIVVTLPVLTNVVGSSPLLNTITVPSTNFVPVTFSVRSGSPILATLGLIEFSTGFSVGSTGGGVGSGCTESGIAPLMELPCSGPPLGPDGTKNPCGGASILGIRTLSSDGSTCAETDGPTTPSACTSPAELVL